MERLIRGAGDIRNAERCLTRLLPDDLVPVTEVQDSCVQWVIMPKDTLEWLRWKNPRLFAHRLGADPESVECFWRGLHSSPQGRHFWRIHPWLRGRSAADLRRHIPVIVHDDAGPVSKSSSAYVRNWWSLLGVGRETETRFLLSTVMKEQHELPDLSWRAILRSFEELSRPVPDDGWGALLLFVGSDLEFACNDLGFTHFNAVQCCYLCGATNGPGAPNNDFSRDALWKGTLKSNRNFKDTFRRPLHGLTAHDFFNIHTYRLDLLHLLDHHGVTSLCIGNIMWPAIVTRSRTVPGETQDARLKFVNDDIRSYYSLQAVQSRMPPSS